MMDDETNLPCLVDLYEGDSCDLITLFETKSEDVLLESEKWKNIIYSHIDRILQSSKSLKIDSLGPGLKWLNSRKPLCLYEELLNKVLVLDFFTYCCINCEHALPFVQQVEEEFKANPEVVVIGVHSPKFPNEKAMDSVRNAVLRNKIKHPVINDPENYLWNNLGVYCWPTVLITSPAHHVLFSLVGEVQIEKLNYLCHQTLNYFKENKIAMNTSPIPLMPSEEYEETNLLYPSGISTDGASIVISDTGHNRLLLLSFNGEVLDVIGSGSAGLRDGSFTDSSFNRPHGTALWKSNFIFVADTGNNCIRLIDLKAQKVSTIFNKNHQSNESEENFASPWDVCLGPEMGSNMNEFNVLYIAVAGSHQIWTMYLNESLHLSDQFSTLKCTPFAGNGNEECRNNTYKLKAGFAQPSGVSYSGSCPGVLFIADSESSTIRSLSLINGSVKTVVGGGLDPKDLFQYGDKDGTGHNVKLQHPLGICLDEEGKIFITDSYNHKIKCINDKKRECITFAGNGNKGVKTDVPLHECEFDEPSAICYSSEKNLLFIADTNNHSIKIIDPEKRTLVVMQIVFPSSSCVDGPISQFHENPSTCEDPSYRKIRLKFGGKIKCSFKLSRPEIKLTKEALQPWNISLKGSCNWNLSCLSNTIFDSTAQPSLTLTCMDSDAEEHYSEIALSSHLTVCDDINKICLRKKIIVKLEVEICSEGSEVYDGIFIFE